MRDHHLVKKIVNVVHLSRLRKSDQVRSPAHFFNFCGRSEIRLIGTTGVCSLPGRHVVAATIFLLLCCSACAPINAYDGDRGDASVATILRTQVVKTGLPQAGITDVDDKPVTRLGVLASEVRVVPGYHIIKLRCLDGRWVSQPSISMNFEPGRKYEVSCEPVGNNRYRGVIGYAGTGLRPIQFNQSTGTLRVSTETNPDALNMNPRPDVVALIPSHSSQEKTYVNELKLSLLHDLDQFVPGQSDLSRTSLVAVVVLDIDAAGRVVPSSAHVAQRSGSAALDAGLDALVSSSSTLHFTPPIDDVKRPGVNAWRLATTLVYVPASASSNATTVEDTQPVASRPVAQNPVPQTSAPLPVGSPVRLQALTASPMPPPVPSVSPPPPPSATTARFEVNDQAFVDLVAKLKSFDARAPGGSILHIELSPTGDVSIHNLDKGGRANGKYRLDSADSRLCFTDVSPNSFLSMQTCYRAYRGVGGQDVELQSTNSSYRLQIRSVD